MICKICEINKPKEEIKLFQKSGCVCRDCDNKRHLAYRNKNIGKSRELALATYHRNKNKKSNKERLKSYNSSYYQEHRETLIQYSIQYAKEHKEEIRTRLKEYRKTYEKVNKDKITARKRKHKEANRELYNERRRKYGKENPETMRMIKQRRRAKKNKLESNFTLKQWRICLDQFDNSCAYCGSTKDIQQDHFVALFSGGEYTVNNIIPACKSCNGSKSDRDFFLWYPLYKFYSQIRMEKILEYLGYIGKDKQQLKLVL